MVSDQIQHVQQPSAFSYILSFILIGVAWGFTTPFIRRAAVEFDARQAAAKQQTQPSPTPSSKPPSWLKTNLAALFSMVVNLLQTPAYTVPLALNLTGSVWFFLLVGKYELSLTVPITNSITFLFTVLGEWYVEGKSISRRTWLGMLLVLGGILLCVVSKN